MANIMITDACNLRCPYCFANEFVNRDHSEITVDAFEKAVNFIVDDGSEKSLGIIGGEPTLHSKFDYLMRKILCDQRIRSVTVFTNGILLDRYWDVLTHPKVHLLINCNSPRDMGEHNYQRLCSNLKTLFCQKLRTDCVHLGINMYRPDFEYEYMLDLLTRFSLDSVRVSVSVPNINNNHNIDPHAYFNSMKPRVLEFFIRLLENNVVPNYDCNKIPLCLITQGELIQFSRFFDNPVVAPKIEESSIFSPFVRCSPVIDILQDLSVVRCFGLSEYTRQKISDFSGIQELSAFYSREIDSYAYNTIYSTQCLDCYHRKVMKCTGGCLAYKIDTILATKQYAENVMRGVLPQQYPC